MEVLPVKSEVVEKIELNVPVLLEKSNAVVIWDETSAAQASDMAKLVSEALKACEDERKNLVKPFNDGVKAINARFKKVTTPLDDCLAGLKSKILKFRLEQEKERLAQAERARAAEAMAEAPKVEAPISLVNRGQFGTTSVRKTWAYKVTDITKVDPALLMVDHSKVMGLIRDGAREIAGLEVYQEESVFVR